MCVGKNTGTKKYVQHSKYGFCLKLEASTRQVNKSCGTAGSLTDEEKHWTNLWPKHNTMKKYRICTYNQ